MFRNSFTIKSRIWITVTLVSFMMIVIGVSLTYFLYERLYVDKQIGLLEKQGALLKEVYLDEQESEKFTQLANWMKDTLNINVIVTEDPMQLSAGIPFQDEMEDNLITFDERQNLLKGSEVLIIRNHPQFDQKIIALAVPIISEEILVGAIFLYMSVDQVYEPFKPIQTLLIIVLLLFLLLLIWGGNRISSSIIRPLKEIEMVSGQMAKGDLTKRIPINHHDEIGKLADSLNSMAHSLQQVEVQRNEFLQNVSHELRTPLSYIKGYTEAILEKVVEKKDVDKYLLIIQKETERLRRLVHELLDLAQLEGNSYPMKMSPIAFAQLIADVVDRFELEAKQKQLHFNLNLDEGVIIEGDSDRLEQVISNLIDNAIRYSPNNSQIQVSLTIRTNESELMIKDFGSGISSEHVPRLFERFYRVEKARSRNEGGAGLGLAIVQNIIKKHRGNIVVESEVEKGTTFRISLPLIMEKRMGHKYFSQ
ncbi:sensor histidine kinase [Bacillus sp. AK128]